MKIKNSTEHLTDRLKQYPDLRQHLDHVAWFTFSEADITNSAPPFLTLIQGIDESNLRYLTLPRQKLWQLITSNGNDFNMHVDYTKQGHVFASRGLPVLPGQAQAERLACASNRQYLTEHYPERDLTEWLDGWQQLAP